MKYEWSKLKFYLEQRDAKSNSSDSNFKHRRDMKNFSNVLVDILRFRTFLFLVLKSAIVKYIQNAQMILLARRMK